MKLLSYILDNINKLITAYILPNLDAIITVVIIIAAVIIIAPALWRNILVGIVKLSDKNNNNNGKDE